MRCCVQLLFHDIDLERAQQTNSCRWCNLLSNYSCDHYVTLTLIECKRQSGVGDAVFCPVTVQWAMQTCRVTAAMVTWSLSNYFRQFQTASEKVKLWCGLLWNLQLRWRCDLGRSGEDDASFCEITLDLTVTLVWCNLSHVDDAIFCRTSA